MSNAKKKRLTLKEAVAAINALGDGDISEISDVSDTDDEWTSAPKSIEDKASQHRKEKKPPKTQKHSQLMPGTQMLEKKVPRRTVKQLLEPADVEPDTADVRTSAPKSTEDKACQPSSQKKPPKTSKHSHPMPETQMLDKKVSRRTEKQLVKTAEVELDTDESVTEEHKADAKVSQAATLMKQSRRPKKSQRWHRKQFVASYANKWKGHVPATTEDELLSAFKYFQRYIGSELYDLAGEQSNRYSLNQTGYCLNTTSTEIRQLFALQILIGILKFPRLRMY